MVSEELIKKYFREDCSDEEKRQIYLYFKENPSAFLDQFSEVDFQATKLPEYPGAKPLSEFDLSETSHQSPFYQKLLYAAAIVVFLFMVGFLYRQNHQTNGIVVAPISTFTGSTVEPKSGFVEINRGKNNIDLELPDHSKVLLYPGSKITYLAFRNPLKRSVVLDGTAIFKVAHDAAKPFTVYCKEVATTAIGTSFKVTTEKGKIRIKLLEGKIRVCSILDKKVQAKIYYLLAGNSISFNRTLNSFTVIDDFAIRKGKIPDEKPEINTPESSVKSLQVGVSTASGTRFDDASLASVLDYLASHYQVKISYPTKVVKRIRFVGTLQRNEPVLSVLKNLALMNNLSLLHDSASNTFVLKELAENIQ